METSTGFQKETAAPIVSEALRGGQTWSRVLRRGQRLVLTDLEGGAAVAALFYNADDPSERYNMPDTLKAQHIARLTAGFVLYSDMGRILVSITRDSLGWHDTITGHGTRAHSEARYGQGTYQQLRNDFFRNTRDNLLVELGKHELGKRDLGPNVNFFVKVAAGADGTLAWVPGHSAAGSSVELRAELNTLVILSNTPHPLDPRPAYGPPPVALEVYGGAPAGPGDACRASRPENERGFTLTEAYFA
ncbi:MAG TPA: urea amidolyase associated protein UAAP1 [Polyangiaceae bacterium]|jgi:urea carboxylase-associated protein 2|nr:urea amidolyase associated protein UAAP1 [Polyangiaceae bacterium]